MKYSKHRTGRTTNYLLLRPSPVAAQMTRHSCVTKPSEAATPRPSILVYLRQSFSLRHFLLCPPGGLSLISRSQRTRRHSDRFRVGGRSSTKEMEDGYFCAGAGRMRCQRSGTAHRWQIRLTDRTGGSKQNSEKRHPSAEECSHDGGAIILHLFFGFFLQGKTGERSMKTIWLFWLLEAA